MTARLKTAICGFGRIAAGYAADPLTQKYFRYSTHVQVLKAHPEFQLEAVADISEPARRSARENWGISSVFATTGEMVAACRPDVLVVATPPAMRSDLSDLPGVRAVILEKPLGIDPGNSATSIRSLRQQGVLVQVNLWRRADPVMQNLSSGRLKESIGDIQAAFGIYGNGLLNNGVHMIDLVRMLAGEVASVRALLPAVKVEAGPVAGDVLVPFQLRMEAGFACCFQPVRFSNYRENSLDLWGTQGRLTIANEGLVIELRRKAANRAIQDEFEVPSDVPEQIESSAGVALYEMYSNLARAVRLGEPLCSPAESALQSEVICHGVRQSADTGLSEVAVPPVRAEGPG